MGGANEAGVERVLPKLQVIHRQNGEIVGIKEMDDPREDYCHQYNLRGAALGRTAEAVIQSPTPLGTPTPSGG